MSSSKLRVSVFNIRPTRDEKGTDFKESISYMVQEESTWQQDLLHNLGDIYKRVCACRLDIRQMEHMFLPMRTNLHIVHHNMPQSQDSLSQTGKDEET